MREEIARACEQLKDNVATYRRGNQLDILGFKRSETRRETR